MLTNTNYSKMTALRAMMPPRVPGKQTNGIVYDHSRSVGIYVKWYYVTSHTIVCSQGNI